MLISFLIKLERKVAPWFLSLNGVIWRVFQTCRKLMNRRVVSLLVLRIWYGYLNTSYKMVRNYKRILGSQLYKNYSPETLDKALNAVNQNNLSAKKAAKNFGIPHRTLLYKLKGDHKKRVGRQPALPIEEEDLLVQKCITLSEWGFPINQFDLRCLVKSFLDRTGKNLKIFKNNMPGDDWAKSFMKRHKELTVRFASNIKRSRAQVSPTMIQQYFDNLKTELDGVDPQHIWNYDETNLTDDPGNKRAIVKRGSKYPERVLNSSKSSISVMFCGNATGELLPPYTVYKAESLWNSWVQGGPARARYNRSKSGWFDSQCFEDWFDTLVLPRLKRQLGPKVLIGDNLSSHLSLHVLQECEANNIRFVALPPNTTHLTQPLDVAFFRPMKIQWRNMLLKFKQGEGKNFCSLPKQKFPGLLKDLLKAIAITCAKNLQSGFHKCGIIPFDPMRVLERLPVSVENGETTKTNEALDDSVVSILKEMRGISNGDLGPKRRKKLNVEPGKSIGVDDVAENIPKDDLNKPSTSSVKRLASRNVNVLKRKERTSDINSDSDDDENPDSILKSLKRDRALDVNDINSQLEHDDTDTSDTMVGLKVKNLKKMDHVIVNYEGELFPGVVLEIKSNKSGATVKAMQMSGVNKWKWPSADDICYYEEADIKAKIKNPKETAQKGVFVIKEINDLKKKYINLKKMVFASEK